MAKGNSERRQQIWQLQLDQRNLGRKKQLFWVRLNTAAKGKRYTPNGKQETARRRAQIAAQQLTPANGLST